MLCDSTCDDFEITTDFHVMSSQFVVEMAVDFLIVLTLIIYQNEPYIEYGRRAQMTT